MPHPFITLGVSDSADDDEVRRAYLAKVRQFPPDGDRPDLFQAVSQAYAAIRDDVGRAKARLFLQLDPEEPLATAVPDAPVLPRRLGVPRWLKAIKEAAKYHG